MPCPADVEMDWDALQEHELRLPPLHYRHRHHAQVRTAKSREGSPGPGAEQVLHAASPGTQTLRAVVALATSLPKPEGGSQVGPQTFFSARTSFMILPSGPPVLKTNDTDHCHPGWARHEHGLCSHAEVMSAQSQVGHLTCPRAWVALRADAVPGSWL